VVPAVGDSSSVSEAGCGGLTSPTKDMPANDKEAMIPVLKI